MRTVILCILIALVAVTPLIAQDAEAPEYVIRNIRVASVDASTAVIAFEVQNRGGPASAPVEATLSAIIDATEQPLETQTIRALGAEGETTVEFTVPLAPYIGAPALSLRAVVLNNDARISVPLPQIPTPSPQATAQAQRSPGTTTVQLPFDLAFDLPFELPFELDLSNPLIIALVIAVLGVLLILIWMVTIILRLLFDRQPTFGAWTPPYTTQPLMDPYSTAGQRQLWQGHAQSDALTVPCVAGSYMARKLLLGTDGTKLDGWRATGMRVSQYDMYGRVARSQAILAPRFINRLNQAVRRSRKLKQRRAQRLVRPVARQIVREVFRRLNRRSAMLPIALDLRFKGQHGEVRIVFELHQCIGDGWQRIDYWEPDMLITSGTIQENFTYALNGQRAGESRRRFRKRLQGDVTKVLVGMVLPPPPMPALADSAPTPEASPTGPSTPPGWDGGQSSVGNVSGLGVEETSRREQR
ncbi:MAG: hypothetical protein GYB67_13760 [Chloroflexi bacterium]|nr:hypothetical protein [Chloroflexota bacterium]